MSSPIHRTPTTPPARTPSPESSLGRRLDRAALTSLSPDVAVPRYLDADDLRIGIVHFGVGNFHRAHQAMYLDRLMNEGLARDWAICGVGVMERDARMRDTLAEQDCLYTLTLRHPDGSDEVSVVGAIRRYLYAPDDPAAVLEQLVSPDVRIVSLTITEGSYFSGAVGSRLPADDPSVATEVAGNLARPLTAFGWIVAALRERRARGIEPFTVLSCDNIQGNGRIARLSIEGVARLVDGELADWIAAEVAFPSTMVDRITPVTTPEDVDRIAAALGAEDAWPVASEPFAQWVIEDHFPTGRPPFERVGVTFTPEIDAYEAIKLRLLNGAHQVMAYVGQLAGYTHVDHAYSDARLVAFVHAYMEHEAAPTLSVPEGFDVPRYMEQLEERFGNPNVRDRLGRLSVDASNRIPQFVLPVLRDRVADGHPCAAGAAMIATWRSYCRAAGEGRFALDDEAADRLIAAASGEPLEFLLGIPALAALAESPMFLDAYLAAVVALESGGADGLLAQFAVPGDRRGPAAA